MLGVIERIKNSVLLKCNTLNDKIIAQDLINLIDSGIYHFAEEMESIISDLNLDIGEKKIRSDVDELISKQIVKKIKRKLFIDSLALQITNDYFIESYVKNEMSLDKLSKIYLKELNKNKSSNQLNMTEDLNMQPIMENVRIYVGKNIISLIKENEFLVSAVNDLVKKTKEEFEEKLKALIDDADLKYKKILIDELEHELEIEKQSEEKGEDVEMRKIEDQNVFEEETNVEVQKEVNSKFEKYDDMTLFNKVILSLNTREEKLSREEAKTEKKKNEIDELLTKTNKDIESNIERENKLSRRKLDLNTREIDLNSKLSEAEVIFLNMKPLIKGLSKISSSEKEGGNYNE